MSTATDLTAKISRRLATVPTADIDKALHDVLAWLGEHTRSNRTYLTQFYRDGTIEVQHEWLDPNLPPHGVAVGVVEADAFAYSIALARDGQRFEVANIADLPPAAESERLSFGAFNVAAILQVPIEVDGAVIGVLGFNSTTPREWTDVEQDLLAVTTSALGVTVARKWTAQELVAAAAETDRARHAASHLVGRFNHELRTPLHVILGYTELLQLRANSAEDIDDLAQIQFNGHRLLALVEDLMRLDHETEEEIDLVSITEVLDGVLDAIGPAVAHRRMLVEVDVDEALKVWFDRRRLRQVLYCQLAATVQNMPPGTSVRYSAIVDEDEAEVVMGVSSQGDQPFAAISMPLADALLDGVAELSITNDTATQWTARFSLPTVAPAER